MPFPFATLFVTIALVSFFVSLRITLRDVRHSAPADFFRVVGLSLLAAFSLRWGIYAIIN